MSLLPDGEVYMTQWDGYSNFLEQSLSETDAETAHWLAVGNMSDSSTSENGIPSAMTSVFRPFASSTTTSSPSEYSPDSIAVPSRKSDIRRPEKRSKGRPKIDLGDAQSAAERRRTQVRLAQQAYRHRKEATVASLKKENEDLKESLASISLAFDQILGITLRVSPGHQSQELDTIHSLCKRVEQFRLPAATTTELNTNKLVGTEGGDQNPTISPVMNETTLKDNGTAAPTNIPRSYDAGQGHQADQPPSQSACFQDSLTDGFSASPMIRTTQLIKDPSISLFEQLPPGPIPFSLRLKHEALKRGYNLITTQETPFSLLFRTFKRCIFSDTREDILRRILYLLNQSNKFIYQTLNEDTVGSSDALNPEKFQKPRQFLESPSRISLNTASDHLPSHLQLDLNETGLDSSEQYIDIERVERYLSERGLNISTGSNLVTIPQSTLLQGTSSPTLFEEIRRSQDLRLSLSKLTYELLDRIVCLELGPGIQALEIDEAIRSTVIAAV